MRPCLPRIRLPWEAAIDITASTQGKGLIMPNEQLPGIEQAFGVLRQFTSSRRSSSEPLERCELCSAGLAHEHPHLVELATRTIVCACDPCALLFDNAAIGKYKRVSRRALRLADFEMTDAQWDGLLIPINMAFFFRSSLENRVVALYPSPAGAVESLLPMEAWQEIEESHGALMQLKPDIEALLVNRVGHAHGSAQAEYYIAPIDDCYRLVGVIRVHWKGLSGGAEVWTEIGRFFSDLRVRSEVISEVPHA
jgi:Family of unknown function (DUF5947)